MGSWTPRSEREDGGLDPGSEEEATGVLTQV